MNPIFAKLKFVSPDTADAYYQAFYPACATGGLSPQAAEGLRDEIQQLYQNTSEPVLKSYCLLFYSAVVDTGALGNGALAKLNQFLSRFLAELDDFRVKDLAGNYVHFLSHATYLAQSIHDAGGQSTWQALLRAFLRADTAFVWNEDIILAAFLLEAVPSKDFEGLLTSLRLDGSEGAKASNKRALWMAMKVLNERTPRQESSAFSELINEVMGLVA